MPASRLSAGYHPATEEAEVRGQRVRSSSSYTRSLLLGGVAPAGSSGNCYFWRFLFTPHDLQTLRIKFPPPLPPPHHSCQTGKTNQLWLLFPINHGIMQTGNSNKMQTSAKTGAPNQISHLHPAASLPDQTLLATPLTPANVAPPLEAKRDGERVINTIKPG